MQMNPAYAVADTANVFSPALLFYKDLIRRNIARCVEMAGGPDRLRPHVKTHKTREIARLQLDAGITRHKCATLAEAEMLAGCGAPDVLLAYPLVGPNGGRLARLIRAYPQCRLSTLIDHPAAARDLSAALVREGQAVDVYLDIDVGQHRTGIAPGPDANALYELASRLPGLRPAGLHVYDGHNHQASYAEREAAVRDLLKPVQQMRASLERQGLSVPRLIVGGTPTFPVFARLDLPGLECSPGTCILHDHGYGSRFGDLAAFVPAALLLTRVISKPTPTRLTLDLGYKAVASDPPANNRCVLLDVPDCQFILQNEEHLVVETPAADRFAPGAEVFAVPTHICPTCALHRQAHVVEGGHVTGTWDIVGRDRVLTI
jgi:D-serine deaminase-like pyridoxal phosphate-dependent protein